MGRGNTLVTKGAVARATRGLLAGASPAGRIENIEVDLVRGIVRLHMIGASGAGTTTATPANDVNEWDTVKQ
jgi:hypothetical protein